MKKIRPQVREKDEKIQKDTKKIFFEIFQNFRIFRIFWIFRLPQAASWRPSGGWAAAAGAFRRRREQQLHLAARHSLDNPFAGRSLGCLTQEFRTARPRTKASTRVAHSHPVQMPLMRRYANDGSRETVGLLGKSKK